MNFYYYIQVSKDDAGYIQELNVDFEELENFKFENYEVIIKKFFKSINASVRLMTGVFNTTVFVPLDNSLEINFCLVDKENYPIEGKKIKLTPEQINHIRKENIRKIDKSEGVYPENVINIVSQFVTPKLKFHKIRKTVDYSFKYFNKDTLVFGPPGSGKTTMLRMITIEILRDYLEKDGELEKLPVYIQLRKFNLLDVSLDIFLDNSITNSFHKFNFLSNEEYLKSGKLILILDGADEIDFEKFKLFRNSISEYKQRHPYISFIISSRPDRSFNDFVDFNNCDIQPFNKKQIKEFTYKKIHGNKKWQDFISVLNATPQVYTLLQNPLMLTFSHFLYQSKNIIPLNTGQLLKELVTVLISSWDSQRKIERKFKSEVVNPNQMMNVLGKLSLILLEKKKDKVNPNKIYKYFTTFETYNLFIEFLQYIEFSTGIIKCNIDEVYFTHRSLQDFFCSNFLVEGVQEINKKVFVDKDWSKNLKLIAGLSSDSNYLIKEIINNDKIGSFEKVNLSLHLFYESNNLSKKDLKLCFDLLENYMIEFENASKLTEKNIKSGFKEMLINTITTIISFKEIVELLKSVMNIRFTKYENDFNSYLSNSNSKLLKSLKNINSHHGDIHIKTIDRVIIISKENVSKK